MGVPKPPRPPLSQPATEEANGSKNKRKRGFNEYQQQQHNNNDTDNDDSEYEIEEEEEEEDDDEEVEVEVKPIGNAVRVSGEVGSILKNHFIGFELDALPYYLEDVVLVVPEGHRLDVKPSVAIIKDVTTIKNEGVTVTGQRLYRPETAKKENGDRWKSDEARELFYSFDKYEFPADNVMHKCQVHFVPSSKKIPSANNYPGFIVQKVYDSASKKLIDLTNTGYEEYKQHEIDVLIMKTLSRIPNLEW
uniref:uncharacterized protein LOC122600207 n=1 Tax=Erigeron canadensis TaxID=72917 RepID=UPI001CB8B2EB|nr:uncharacterized protein LOC122600207 [Erigeron canadensis]